MTRGTNLMQQFIYYYIFIITYCCIKLVPLVIFIYDARTHIRTYKMYIFN